LKHSRLIEVKQFSKVVGTSVVHGLSRNKRGKVGLLNTEEDQLVGCVAQWLERWSLTGELSLIHARPAADG